MKAIDEGMMDVSKAIVGADLVVLGGPSRSSLRYRGDLQAFAPAVYRERMWGSTKASIVDLAEKLFPPHVLFVGSHPMAVQRRAG